MDNKYKDLIENIDLSELNEKINNKELDLDSNVSKIWAINYMADTSDKTAEIMVDFLVGNEIIDVIILDPENIFEKIYSIKNYKDEEDTILIFKDNIIDTSELQKLYDDETINKFSLKCYLDDQNEKLENYKPKEKYDPLNFEKTQNDINKAIEKMNEKIKSNDIDLDKLKDMLSKGKISLKEFYDIIGLEEEEE